MSSKDERAFYGWLLFGEPFPFFQDFEDIPLPDMKEPEVPKKFQAKLSDYHCGGNTYRDGNGDYLTKEEAQAEVDWYNKG